MIRKTISPFESTSFEPFQHSSHTHLTRLLAGRHVVMVWTSLNSHQMLICHDFFEIPISHCTFPVKKSSILPQSKQNIRLFNREFAKCLALMQKNLFFLLHVDAQCRGGINGVSVFAELIFVYYCLLIKKMKQCCFHGAHLFHKQLISLVEHIIGFSALRLNRKG